jgi:predicted GIY-YIG superfamily endonuclease
MATTSRVTLNLNLNAQTNAEYIGITEDINRTDAIHRALELYAFLLRERANGQDLLLRNPDGEITKVAWR